MLHTEGILEEIEQNESHKLFGKLPRRSWEIQFLIIDSEVRKELSKKPSVVWISSHSFIFWPFQPLDILVIISGRSLG